MFRQDHMVGDLLLRKRSMSVIPFGYPVEKP